MKMVLSARCVLSTPFTKPEAALLTAARRFTDRTGALTCPDQVRLPALLAGLTVSVFSRRYNSRTCKDCKSSSISLASRDEPIVGESVNAAVEGC
jgi:hypothetical protein